MKKLVFLLMLASLPGWGQVINCTSFSHTQGVACGVGFPGDPENLYAWNIIGNGSGGAISGGAVPIQSTTASHNPANMNYNPSAISGSAPSVEAFKVNFLINNNGWNFAFYVQNNNNSGGPVGFGGGAGCEGGIYQGFDLPAPINNVLAINFDGTNQNTPGGFTYSHVQLYQPVQSPCIPNDGQAWYYATNSISTSPVQMNSPASTITTCFQTVSGTCDTYNVTVLYTGKTLTVNLFDSTAGGSCPGASCFVYSWQDVNIPSLIDGTTGYPGITGSSNGAPANANALLLQKLVYTVLSAASAPSCTNSSGTITCTTSSSGANIYYNTTGNPADDGNGNALAGTTLYTGPFTLSNSGTVYAIAGTGSSSYGDSTVAATAFTIGSTAATPTFSPAQGTYQGNQTVYLNAPSGQAITYCTTTTTCTPSTSYTGTPITVSSNESIFAFATKSGLTQSSTTSAAYVISPYATTYNSNLYTPAASPTFSPGPGTYTGTQSVTLSSTTSGSNICYLFVASSTPPAQLPYPSSQGGCVIGTAYSSAVAVTTSGILYASAGTNVGDETAGTGPPSSVSSAQFTISGTSPASTPTFSPVAGSYGPSQSVTISTTSSGAIICYNTTGSPATNGSTGCTTGTLYSGPVTVSSTETLYAVAGGTGFTDSSVGSAAYTINGAVAKPTFSPVAGAYLTTQSVTISTTTPGASLFYNTTGSPTCSSTPYTGPVSVSSSQTLYAVGCKTGFSNSTVASATYTIGSTITCTGNMTVSGNVSIGP